MRAERPAVLQDGPDVLLHVQAHPRAPRNEAVVTGSGPGEAGPAGIVLRVTAPPAEGAANAACRALLAEILGMAKSRILIVRGQTARHKLFRIRDADAATILAHLQSRK